MNNPTPPLESLTVALDDRLSLLPSNIVLANAEIELQSKISRETRLKFTLGQADYDYIIIDCPPSLGILTINGLVAADYVIIPVQAEYYAMMGVRQILESIDAIKINRLNDDLEILGVLITRYDERKNLCKGIRELLLKEARVRVFETLIRDNVKVAEAPSYGMSIGKYDAKSAGAADYDKFGKEVIHILTEQEKENS
jgi:chromosome partitioning protein